MRNRYPLTLLMVLLVLSLAIGFSLLSLVWELSLLGATMVGLLLAGLSVVLLVSAVKFDRQMQKRENKNEETTT